MLQVRENHSGNRNALMLRSGNLMVFWSKFQESLIAERVYYNYYMSYFEAFAGVNESKPTEEEVAKTAAMESDILGRLMEARSIVDRTLEDITESASERFATVALGSNSSSSNTSAAAKSKLDKLLVSLWPPDSLLKWRALSEMYSSFAPAQESIARYWVHGHERLRQLSEQRQYAQALAQRANFLMPLIRYDYLRNVVSVSVATLQRPLFYLYGTPAMTHGGLGFTFAKELVKAVDSTGLMVAFWVETLVSGEVYQKI
ncbi:hypothetical protein V5799_028083 [Amblyomma americanum]|uniref:Uncharacterized protein n=1 Tax=Amblyomma americanum TaxID=6943 RepID=A0AAQ4DDW1_AMBAM